MTKTKNKPVVAKQAIEPWFYSGPAGEISFELEYDTVQVQWPFEKVGRQLEISFFAELNTVEEYKKFHEHWFGKNFINEHLLVDGSLQVLDELLNRIKQRKLLFDMIIIEADIVFNDPDDCFFGEFSHFHGIGLTVNGRKHLES